MNKFDRAKLALVEDTAMQRAAMSWDDETSAECNRDALQAACRAYHAYMMDRMHARAVPDRAWPTRGPWALWHRRPGVWNGARIVGADGTHIASLSGNADKPTDQKAADGEMIVAAVNRAMGYS